MMDHPVALIVATEDERARIQPLFSARDQMYVMTINQTDAHRGRRFRGIIVTDQAHRMMMMQTERRRQFMDAVVTRLLPDAPGPVYL